MKPSMLATTSCALLLFALAPDALAKPRIQVSITQAKEVTLSKPGAKTAKFVPVKEASPGDLIEYTLTYTNAGDELARDAVIDDPIPKGASYVASSATGDGAEITFSTDGGKTFAAAVKLTYEIRLPTGLMEKRIATPSEYTHVRWTLRKIAPGASGKVRFRVRVN